MYRLSMRPLAIETPRVLFDISRLLRSVDKPFGTGVDRIDLAIGLGLLQKFGEDCSFVHAGGHGLCLVAQSLGRAILDRLDSVWNDVGTVPAKISPMSRLRRTVEPHVRNLLFRVDEKVVSSDTTYVVSSHSGVGKVAGGMRRLDPDRRMRRLLYIHDLIPVEYPEYQRPETFGQFSRYLQQLTDAPVTVVSNSHDTDGRVRKYAAREGWMLAGSDVVVPTLEFRKAKQAPLSNPVLDFLQNQSPFFVVLGTIEPRKNHLLLLHIWRELAQTEDAPRLCIIGKRGWENENVIDMLERCRALEDTVVEFSGLSDHEVQTLLSRSRALLFPSFAEGLGIPILEAEALGVPCVVSDIPVFREIAPVNTVFLDPLDGKGWMREIASRTAQAEGLCKAEDRT